MEKLYLDVLKREEERIAYQNKIVLLYQKELRNRRGKVIATMKKSEQRKKAIETEKELDQLWHNIETEKLRDRTQLMIAEEQMRDEDITLLAQMQNMKPKCQSLSQKYADDIKRISEERDRLKHNIKKTSLNLNVSSERNSCNLQEIERRFNLIQNQFLKLKNSS
ncbi:uncharacterized protein LOC119675138 [Teleopsis dalmanni]|uniref:uncharacterized protein LOC119675138 n=1 Tax=Teleopsis dalmanni TaxID=139649 RepID=UPI0018CDFBE5|nr:uncharacterized protein LOC119675138 [Teleopsis dalmanni]